MDSNAEPTISENLLREYGNNLFELVTYDPSIKDGQIKLIGVLKQIPSFNMGTAWRSGPAASLSDILKGYLCSDLMEMMMAIGGSDKSWSSVDEASDRTFEECKTPSFNLEFRLYPGQNIGTTSLTTYDTWISALSLFAQPSIASKINVNAIANNAVNGAIHGLDKFKTATEKMVETVAGTKVPDSESTINVLANTVGNIVDDTAVLVTNRDDKNRVEGTANKKSFYGAKLWKLNILPGLIEKPIVVYIENWSVTYSKEINFETGKPIYVDFTVNCALDQIPDAGLWMYYMDKNRNETGVFTGYERTNLKATDLAENIKEPEIKITDLGNGRKQIVHIDETGQSNYVAYTNPDGSRKIVHQGSAKVGEQYTKQGMETHTPPPGYHWKKQNFAEVWELEVDAGYIDQNWSIGGALHDVYDFLN